MCRVMRYVTVRVAPKMELFKIKGYYNYWLILLIRESVHDSLQLVVQITQINYVIKHPVHFLLRKSVDFDR